MLVATGDFDGYKKGDIGRVHPANGSVWLSLGTCAGFTTSLLPFTYAPASSDAMDLDVTP